MSEMGCGGSTLCRRLNSKDGAVGKSHADGTVSERRSTSACLSVGTRRMVPAELLEPSIPEPTPHALQYRRPSAKGRRPHQCSWTARPMPRSPDALAARPEICFSTIADEVPSHSAINRPRSISSVAKTSAASICAGHATPVFFICSTTPLASWSRFDSEDVAGSIGWVICGGESG